MMTRQVFSTGDALWQDFSAAVRPVFFDTDIEEWRYASHGGTLFLVEYHERVFGLTCGHVFRGFEDEKLFISRGQFPQKGAPPAPVKGKCLSTASKGEAHGTDVTDLCMIEFAGDMAPNFFHGTAYRIDANTIGTSQHGHHLRIAGVLKDKTTFIPPNIAAGYCSLDVIDNGPATFDPLLRHAIAQFGPIKFDNLVGMSGSPVFDVASNVLCGMVCRAGMSDNRANIYYFDIFDVIRFLEAASNRSSGMHYTKSLSS
jgi:hypothetical protein